MSLSSQTVSQSNIANVETPALIYKRISGFSMPAAVDYYARTSGIDAAIAENHYQELLKYLSMAAVYPGKVTPSDQLDDMWHAALIQTKHYSALCDRIGRFVHHSTEAEPQDGSYKNALEIYWNNFGELHPVWTAPKVRRAEATEKECDECEVVGWCSSSG